MTEGCGGRVEFEGVVDRLLSAALSGGGGVSVETVEGRRRGGGGGIPAI